MINVSVDPPNFKQAGTVTAGTSTDEIDSIFELISESVFDNDIPESEGDDNDLDESSNSLQLYFTAPNNDLDLASFFSPKKRYSFYQDNFSGLIPEPTSPPPKRA